MDFRGLRSVMLVGVLSAAALAGASTSCSGPDPGSITFAERPKGSSGELATPEGGAVGEGGAGEGGTGDGGSKEAGPAGDPVFGTSAFAAMPPTEAAKGQATHVANANAAIPAGSLDPSGIDCVVGGCHLDARPWGFGGTLYGDAAGTTRVAGAEIRVTGPDGKVFGSAYSDVDGNFWFDGMDPKVPANSRVGVRNGTKFLDMGGTIGGEAMGGVGCQKAAGCHGAASPGKVYLK